MTLVSVLIPAYNHEKYVQETIKSIINQTYKNIELIVVDDGSKDTTWQKMQEIKEECEKRFVRVHFETKENEGTCMTLNKLVSLAKGEYVYLIASDDIAVSNAIELEVDFLNANPEYALVVGDDGIIDSEGQICYWDKDRNNVYDEKQACYKTFGDLLKHSRKSIDFNSSDFGTYKTLYVGNYIPNGFLVRKSIYDIIGCYTTEAPLEDFWMMLQISKYAKMKYIDKILFYYRWHGANSVVNKDKMREVGLKTYAYEEKILSQIDESKVYPEVVEIKKYGLLFKKRGIPFVFQILTYKKEQQKTRVIKLFNITIYKYKKS